MLMLFSATCTHMLSKFICTVGELRTLFGTSLFSYPEFSQQSKTKILTLINACVHFTNSYENAFS